MTSEVDAAAAGAMTSEVAAAAAGAMVSEVGALPWQTKMLIGSFATSGVVHMARPEVFASLIPPQLGSPRAWTYASGVAELACAVGLWRREPWAPKATALVLTGVWVGNWWMAVRVTRSERKSRAMKIATWVRVPLQVPMIRWALDSTAR